MPTHSTDVEIEWTRRVQITSCEGSMSLRVQGRSTGRGWETITQIDLGPRTCYALIEALMDESTRNEPYWRIYSRDKGDIKCI